MRRPPATFRACLDSAVRDAANGAQFIMWPESSTPFYFEEDPSGMAVRKHRVFVTNSNSDSVSVVDVRRRAVEAVLPVRPCWS